MSKKYKAGIVAGALVLSAVAGLWLTVERGHSRKFAFLRRATVGSWVCVDRSKVGGERVEIDFRKNGTFQIERCVLEGEMWVKIKQESGTFKVFQSGLDSGHLELDGYGDPKKLNLRIENSNVVSLELSEPGGDSKRFFKKGP